MIVIDILLWILKWLGILLLALLGLLLFVVLLVLLVPVRYRGRLSKMEEPEERFTGEGRITWLNPILRIRIRYEGKKLCYRVRLFGFSIINSEAPKKEKKKKKETTEPMTGTGTLEEPPSGELQISVEGSEVQTENGTEEVPSVEESGTEEVQQQTDASGPVTEEDSEGTSEGEETTEESEEQEKVSFFTKIKQFFGKIGAFFAKLKHLGANVKRQLSLLWYKKGQVTGFLKGEVQKLAFGKAWSTVKKVLRHIMPRKIKGYVEFGTGNPESTGKALAAISMFYAAYGKHLKIVPEFMEKRLVAEVSFKGRIRFGTLARLGLSLIRDKNIKGFRKNWKKLLKELKKKAE